MTTKLRFALIGLAVFGGGFAVSGVALSLLDGGGGGAAQPVSAGQLRWTIEDARQFKEFPLYWLGEEFQGLPLTTIIRHRFEPGPDMRPGLRGENSVTFIYGDCTPTGDSGCPPPVQVIVEAYCTRPPELLAEEVKDGPPIDLRGALAQPLGPDQVMAWTGDARVTVFDVRGGGVALATMEALTAVTGTGGRDGGHCHNLRQRPAGGEQRRHGRRRQGQPN